MARAFRRKGRGEDLRYVASLDADERDVVASLMEQVAGLLEPPEQTATGDEAFDALVAGISLDGDPGAGDAGPAQERPGDRDPALDRLLPAAHREDAEASREFRRLTEGGLRHRKADGLQRAVAALRTPGGDLALDAPAAGTFLTALTDVRLVLGSRLGLESDEDLDALEARAARLDPADPLGHALALYDFLTWLQETLASALLRA
ncbi:DUF2017 family protein [Phycicoccus flavus]|uniref:DUF2017 domain-containing protein n=1 Tax=Phycicoccus flavus TaxID=2502783 RepID=A0A8T6R4K6_9MICO|nr:DUF2017 family protein [Phycicoccus flavus]NHA68796.1 DUF2017 domain-containing protein [Phycicoccus flavus]